jgi:2-phosphoglycerate kinase
MSFIDDQLASVMDAVKALNPATMVHGSNTYTAYKSYGPSLGEDMQAAGFLSQTEDISVILSVADIIAPTPVVDDAVTLGGEDYIIRRIVPTAAYLWITLGNSR